MARHLPVRTASAGRAKLGAAGAELAEARYRACPRASKASNGVAMMKGFEWFKC